MNSTDLTAVSLSIIALSLSSVLFFQIEDSEIKNEQINYCELVEIFEHQGELGIKEQHRDGIPNYKNLDCDAIKSDLKNGS